MIANGLRPGLKAADIVIVGVGVMGAAAGRAPVDLFSFADWSVGSDAEIVSLADRRQN